MRLLSRIAGSEALNDFLANRRDYGLRAAVRTLIWNVRFNLGYWIGGFKRASR